MRGQFEVTKETIERIAKGIEAMTNVNDPVLLRSSLLEIATAAIQDMQRHAIQSNQDFVRDANNMLR